MSTQQDWVTKQHHFIVSNKIKLSNGHLYPSEWNIELAYNFSFKSCFSVSSKVYLFTFIISVFFSFMFCPTKDDVKKKLIKKTYRKIIRPILKFGLFINYWKLDDSTSGATNC